PAISVSALDGSDPGVAPAVGGSTWEIVFDGGPTLIVTKVVDMAGTHLLVSRATIDAVAAAASLAVGIGDVGVAVSGAGAIAFNVVLTRTNAYIDSSKITSGGALSLSATGTSGITATIA